MIGPAIRSLGVVVPAADEAERIGNCLASIITAREALRDVRPGIDVDVVVVLDGCTDNTEDVVARYPGVRSVACSLRRVGATRAFGVAAIRADVAPEHNWLASTDADSRVPAHWLTAMIDFAEAGADLVLGTVLPDRADVEARWTPAADVEWHRRHALLDGHPYVHGANLGIRRDLYATIGGWPDVASGEDVTLVATAALRPGVQVVRTAGIPVHTSPRLTGRTPHGFATYVRDLAG